MLENQSEKALRAVDRRAIQFILLAVQNDASFVSQLPRPVRLHRHIGIFQQLRDFFTASIQTARSIIDSRWRDLKLRLLAPRQSIYLTKTLVLLSLPADAIRRSIPNIGYNFSNFTMFFQGFSGLMKLLLQVIVLEIVKFFPACHQSAVIDNRLAVVYVASFLFSICNVRNNLIAENAWF